jgi:DNA-binding CsgD family transcriptional regulator
VKTTGPTPETALKLIETLYRAVLCPELLGEFCARLNDATGCHIGAMFLLDYHGVGSNFFASDGLDVAIIERYDQEFAGHNILMERALPEMHAGMVSVSEQYLTDQEWKASAFYNEFCKPQDAYHVSGGCIAYDRGVSSMLTLARNEHGGPFTADELSLMRCLLPHLRNVLEVQRRLGFVELRAEIGWQIVDRLPFAVLCITESLSICFANTRARRLLAACDGVFERSGRLVVTESHDRERLQALCGRCAQKKAHAGGPVHIRRRGILSALTGYMCSIELDNLPPGLFNRPVAILLLADPSEEVSGTQESLQVQFGFTRAEARLALQLVQGSSLRRISEESKTSINTVKTHLKHLMNHTGTARQSELVAYLLKGMIRLSEAGNLNGARRQ